ncbi:MAG: beta-mannosidase [Candidatus Sumerlaeia bacterium]
MQTQKQISTIDQNWELRQSDQDEILCIPQMPMQVHDVLVHHGLIEPPIEKGKQEPCQWVAEKNWTYRTRFTANPEEGHRRFLGFQGLDTLVDVVLNGKKIVRFNDCYYPHRVDVTDVLQEENELELQFTSPLNFRDAAKDAGEDQQETAHMRGSGGHSFNGAQPCFYTIGVYGPVTLETVHVAEFDWVDIRTGIRPDFSEANVEIEPFLHEYAKADLKVEATLYDPDGKACDSLTVQNPRLWYPVGYGDQPLYRLEILLKEGDKVLDALCKTIGFRLLQRHGEFDYSVNGKRVKLWGANFTPMATATLVWDRAKAERLLDHAVNCNMTSLRLWGPGLPWDEHLIEEADKRGLLLWFEFSHSGPRQPDDDTFRDMCRREAEYYVKNWKHHPSIFMWCGGNETYLGIQKSNRPESRIVGDQVFTETYRKVCEQFDPEREYIVNSPYGGPYGNCTFEGDVHVRSYDWYEPGLDFPKCPSEHVRATIPLKKTLQKHFGEDLEWPEGFTGRRTHFNEPFLPPSWSSIMLWAKHDSINSRLGHVRDFFDPDGTPESLLFVMGAGTSRYIRQTIERYRRGKPASDPDSERRVMAHYWWKYNDTFPMIYASLVDDLDEANMAYYAMRRAYQPLLLSIEVADSINLWVVNDTPDDITGSMKVQVFDMRAEKCLHEKDIDISVSQGQSVLVGNCDDFGMFYTRNPIFAQIFDASGNPIASSLEYPCTDVQSWHHESKIEMRQEGDELVLTADIPTRWIELQGDADGDAFGWYFEDNFFDLMPGIEKRVRILGRHKKGTITAWSPYTPHQAKLDMQ